MNLSEVITVLTDENQNTTALTITDEAIPYSIDSKVSGLFHGRYSSIVTP